MAVGLTKYR